MMTERVIRTLAGSFLLLSLSFGVEASPLFHSVNWLWFSAFIGFNLLQSGITGFCPPEFLFRKLAVKNT